MTQHNEISLTGVSFTYEGAATNIFDSVTLSFSNGFTGIVGANGAGKSTLLRIAKGDLALTSGIVRANGAFRVSVEQRTDEEPPEFAEFLFDYAKDACRIKAHLGIDEAWYGRWATLSHGERKRAQIALALATRPDALFIDEPTNHLDEQGKVYLLAALRAYEGIGVIVCHDRAFLDALATAIVFIDPPHAVKRMGNYTAAEEDRTREHAHMKGEYARAKQEAARIEREYITRRQEAARSHAERSKKGLASKDHDGRFRKNIARITGKDGSAGKRKRQLEGRLTQARERVDAYAVRKEARVGIWWETTRSRRRFLFTQEETELPLGDGRTLALPALTLRADDRVGIVGENGCGKTTLLRHLIRNGYVREDETVYIPQEITREEARAVLARVHALDNEERCMLFTIVKRLNSSPARLFDSALPSPGEVRKLLLAKGIMRHPSLIIMDEPTNHLDLPSRSALESAFAECPAALILVSHDAHFLSACVTRYWRYRTEGMRNVLDVVDAAPYERKSPFPHRE